jgi:ABC-2 type transport system ATP-binding protein
MSNESGSAVLAAEHLSVRRGEQEVLNDISFSVGQGEVFALLGGNGAGKSTTLLTFLGFLAPTGGAAMVNGLPAHDNMKAVHQQVAYLPEAAQLYAHLNAWENLDYFLSIAKVEHSRAAIDQALDTVALARDARGRPLSAYSKGMRQKVGIALAILREAPILLLDEPTSGLDPVAIDEFNAIVINLARQGTTILMVTHDVYGACQVARNIALLQKGQMVGHFTKAGDQPISADEVHRQFAEYHRS